MALRREENNEEGFNRDNSVRSRRRGAGGSLEIGLLGGVLTWNASSRVSAAVIAVAWGGWFVGPDHVVRVAFPSYETTLALVCLLVAAQGDVERERVSECVEIARAGREKRSTRRSPCSRPAGRPRHAGHGSHAVLQDVGFGQLGPRASKVSRLSDADPPNWRSPKYLRPTGWRQFNRS